MVDVNENEREEEQQEENRADGRRDGGTDVTQIANHCRYQREWDKHKRRLFCARDRFGEKPFYYSVHKGQLYFASELKSLTAIDGIDKSVDIKAVDDYLAYGYIPAPRSIYKSISKLPQAHILVWESGSLHTSCYWAPSFPESPLKIDEDEAVQQLRSLIEDSIRLRLRSDVPVGAFLSGGIDSSLMVSLAAQQSEQTLSTFSVGFSEQDFDELGYAKLIAERYQTNHREIIIEDLDLSLFPEIVAQFDEPFGDASAIPTYYVTREAARHLKVCISGDAGDEFFCGYTRYQWEPFEQLFDLVPGRIRDAALNGLADLLPDHFRGKGRLRRFALSGHLRYQSKMAPFDLPERRVLFRPEHRDAIDHSASYFAPYFDRSDMDPISQRMYADQNTYLPDDILVKVDRNSMWHSLEVRVPFLDYRIADFANSLPLDMKMRDKNQKYILKRVLQDLVPPEVVNRGKKGFGLPLVHWLRDRFNSYSQDLLLSSDSRASQFFQPETIKAFVDGHQRGTRDLSRRIWTLLWFEQWCRSNGI